MPMQEVKAPTIPFIPTESVGIHAPLRGDDYFSLARQQIQPDIQIHAGDRQFSVSTNRFPQVDQARYGERSVSYIGQAGRASRENRVSIKARESQNPSAAAAAMAFAPEIASVAAAGATAAVSKKNRFRNAALVGMGVESALRNGACAPTGQETAPVRIAEVQQASVISEMGSWDGKALPDGTVLSSPFDVQYVKPEYALSQNPEIPGAEIPYPGSVYLSWIGDENFFLFVDGKGNVTESAHMQAAPYQTAGSMTFQLVTAEGKSVGNVAFNLSGNLAEPMAKLTYSDVVVDPSTSAKVNQTTDLAFGEATQSSPAKMQEFLDYFVGLSTGAQPVFAAGEGTAVAAVPATPTAESVAAPATPTEAPTAVPTPTENLLAGAPDGATGKDAVTGEWTKPNPERPESPFHYKQIIDPNSKETIVQGWFQDVVVNPTYNGGLPLIDELGNGTQMAVRIWCKEGVACPTIQHDANGDKVTQGLSFTRLLVTDLYHRAGAIYPQYKDNGELFNKDLAAGKIVFPYIAEDGGSYEYRISGETAANIYVVSDGDFVPGFKRGNWQKTVFGDEAGNFNAVVATVEGKLPMSSMTKDQFFELTMFPVFNAVLTEDQSVNGFLNNLSTITAVDQLFGAASNKSNPWIY